MSAGFDVDVLVAGGGPVGLAAAVEARLAGFEVALLEPRPDPVDKACGEGLMPGAVTALRRLGVEVGGQPFAGIAYTDGRYRAEHRFSSGPGAGVRRTQLQGALGQRADEAGVRRERGRVEGVVQSGAGLRAGGLSARWLLACDGLHSPLRRALGLDAGSGAGSDAGSDGGRYGLRRHARVAPWTDVVEVHWSPHAEAYVTPVAPDVVGVALLGPRGRPYDEVLGDFPQLLERLDGSEPASDVRGAGPLRQRARNRVAGRVLLVGDAGGYVDALTGEGLRVGLAQAAAAVQCLQAGRPADYEHRWRRVTRDYRWLTTALLAAARTGPTRRAIVPAAARLPRVFGAAVERLAR